MLEEEYKIQVGVYKVKTFRTTQALMAWESFISFYRPSIKSSFMEHK